MHFIIRTKIYSSPWKGSFEAKHFFHGSDRWIAGNVMSRHYAFPLVSYVISFPLSPLSIIGEAFSPSIQPRTILHSRLLWDWQTLSFSLISSLNYIHIRLRGPSSAKDNSPQVFISTHFISPFSSYSRFLSPGRVVVDICLHLIKYHLCQFTNLSMVDKEQLSLFSISLCCPLAMWRSPPTNFGSI